MRNLQDAYRRLASFRCELLRYPSPLPAWGDAAGDTPCTRTLGRAGRVLGVRRASLGVKRAVKSGAFLVPECGQSLLWAGLEKGVPAGGGGGGCVGERVLCWGRGPVSSCHPPAAPGAALWHFRLLHPQKNCP